VVKGNYLNSSIQHISHLIDFRYECLVLGQQEYAAEYRDKLYFLLDEDAREKFMRFIYLISIHLSFLFNFVSSIDNRKNTGIYLYQINFLRRELLLI
jgi:hypothetical protein